MSAYVEPKRPEEMTPEELVARVHLLEVGLLPFAKIAVVMEDARMRLAAEGRQGEPAGGHWVNNLRNTSMTPSEVYFYAALQIRGRGDVEVRMLADMDKMVELTTATEEKAAAVDTGTRTDN